MRLTSFTDFGLRLLMRMAAEPQRLFTTEQLARELELSRHHLVKVVGELRRAGIVDARKGARGGICLGRPAAAISIGEVVRCLEKRSALVECFRADGGLCTLTPSCRLRHRLAAAREAFLAELDAASLAECAWPSEPLPTVASGAGAAGWEAST